MYPLFNLALCVLKDFNIPLVLVDSMPPKLIKGQEKLFGLDENELVGVRCTIEGIFVQSAKNKFHKF